MSAPNRLIHEASPYLLQHAYNPVDWYAWGPEPFERARQLDRPIFLSIGYSACHWCHVMEAESFSDPATAKILNDNFVCIKVDKEERPDLDQFFMASVQLLSHSGGWPLSVFLTVDRQPFYGGTYFPPTDRLGLPCFQRVLTGITTVWNSRRQEVLQTALQLSTSIQSYFESCLVSKRLPDYPALLGAFIAAATPHLDAAFGGIGDSPKFFHTPQLYLFLRHFQLTGFAQSLEAVRFTLDHISRGGIHDQLAGGFHRYSTDRQWLVPHFEKMLYDNALLGALYIEALVETQDLALLATARKTLDFLIRDMRSAQGGFYSTIDADSENTEGRFYVWTQQEIDRALPADEAPLFSEFYGVTIAGNWENTNILHIPNPIQDFCANRKLDVSDTQDRLSSARRRLITYRSRRPHPHRDEKVIAAWNGMVISALARAGFTLNDTEYLSAATDAAQFMLDKLWKNGRLGHSIIGDRVITTGYLDDHAFAINGLVELFLATNNTQWLTRANEIAGAMITHFWNAQRGAFYFSSSQDFDLFTRPIDFQDGATPSAAAQATTALARLSLIDMDSAMASIAHQALTAVSGPLVDNPLFGAQWLIAADYLLHDKKALVFCRGTSESENDRVTLQAPQLTGTHLWIVNSPELTALVPAYQDKKAVGAVETLFVCTASHCAPPVVGADNILMHLKALKH